MINFIIGAGGSGKSRTVCDMILNEIQNGGRDVVLIVPEQQAVAWETRMSELLPPSANLRLEITNFTRLPNAVFREYGGLSDAVVDEGSRALIVWRAMLAVSEELKVYTAGSNGHEDRAIPFLMTAVDELKQSGISPQAAELALEELTKLNDDDDGKGALSSLASRLSDAVNVYAAYNAILHEDFIDRGDLLDNLAAALRAHPYFKGKAVFIDSFFSLTAPEEKILSLILTQADDVTVTFACPADEEKRKKIQFGEIVGFMKRVSAMAARAGKDVTKTLLGENHRHAGKEELGAVEDGLFGDCEKAKEEERPLSSDVQIIRCADRYDEAEACASIILKLIREGCRYSDIAVVARDISSREGIIDTVLRRHGIRCFMSESSEVSSSPAVKLVLAALSVAAGGWQRQDIIRLLKTGMTPICDGEGLLGALEGDVFETYTYTWNIRGRKMYCSDDWTMNPEGYSDRMTDADAEILRAANECRRKMMPPLDRLLSIFGDGRGVASVRDIAERIVMFADEYGVADSLARMSESYSKIGMEREAARTLGSWNYVCEILDKMVAVLGDTPLNVVRFARLFGRLAADLDKGSIPTGVDEVVLGSATGVRFDSVRCVIILGALEGEFPRSPDDTGGFFDERDKVALETVGLNISSPDADTQLAREYFMFYRTAAAAEEKLYVLAPTGGGSALSAGAEDIANILAAKGRNAVRVFGAMPLSEILYDKVTAEYLLSRRADESEREYLRSIAGAADKNRISLTAENDRTSPSVKRGETMRLSQSAITQFVRCRFQYYCEKMARLSPVKKADIKLNNVGTFIHAIFEKFFTQIPAEKIRSGELTKEEMSSVAEELITDYIDALAESGGHNRGEYDGRLKYLFARLTRYVLVFIEAMCRELEQSRFVPVQFEMPIGKDVEGKEKLNPIEFRTADGTTVSVIGIADRVDVYDAPDGRRYARVVDYKTGSKEFSIDKLEKGLEIQLLIYLFTVWKFGLPNDEREVLPAGAVYFSTYPKANNAESITAAEQNREEVIESVARSGVLLDDEDVLRAMDKELDGRFVMIKKNKDGEPASTKTTVLETMEGFADLYDQLGGVITRIADEMRSGMAEARPSRDGGKVQCDNCEFALVCKSKVRDKE